MRTLFIADIHANLIALHALPVADQIICAGDLVGYGSRPAEVLAFLRNAGATCVRGDEDDAIGNDVDHVAPPGLVHACRETRDVAIHQLSGADRAFLAGLPPEAELMIGRLRVAVTHAYPGDYERYIEPTPSQLDRIANAYPNADLIVLGHTHRPGSWHVRNTTILNPGSVGQPQHPGFASYGLLADGKLHLGEARFDIDAVIRDINRQQLSAQAIRECERAILQGALRPHDRVERPLRTGSRDAAHLASRV